jgi:RES domain
VFSTTWTPTAVASELRPWQGTLWRAVEAQHRVSTLRLVDTLEEQSLLESLLEESKPALPSSLRQQHYLVTTPFRYPPLHPSGSRFRGSADPGVFYGALERRTACAELGYWRWRFLLDSPALQRLESLAQTLFESGVDAVAVDLREPPFLQDAKRWTDPIDYTGCQSFARLAREAGAQAIRYGSVRDPEHGQCVAVLAAPAFTAREIVEQRWRLSITPTRVFWQRDSVLVAEGFEFETATWTRALRA